MAVWARRDVVGSGPEGLRVDVRLQRQLLHLLPAVPLKQIPLQDPLNLLPGTNAIKLFSLS